jgi:Stress responsive A/B Barrel Domain
LRYDWGSPIPTQNLFPRKGFPMRVFHSLQISMCIVGLIATLSSAIAAPPATAVQSSEKPVESNAKVLRHAVFFSFKETSTEADVQSVADAFAALPDKIDVITDFQWGVNNSPEGLDDGFTHCFLLTFKDAAGRDAYIPHPAHKGEFANVLRPHMKDVFVFDYDGVESETPIKKELKHAVFLKFKDGAAKADIKKVEQAFAALPSKIDSIKAFEWGLNNSPEKKDDGFTHCFMLTFDSEEGRKAYLPHPDHLAFVEILKPVLDKVRVLDFWEQ